MRRPGVIAASLRRAFVTPIVVLLVLVVALTATVMYERQSAVRLSVNRRLEGYHTHHMGRGVTEIVAAWLEAVRGARLSDGLGDDGHALDVRVRDGTVFRIFLRDAQGTLLDPSAGMAGERAGEARELLSALREVSPGEAPPEWLRPVGPLTVCAASAPRPVLEAVIEHATDGEAGGASVLGEILSARDDREGLEENELTTAIASGGFESEVRRSLEGLLVAEPTLWRVRVEVIPPRRAGPGRERVVYEGYSELGQSGGALGADALMPWRMFLTWERVEGDG